MRSERAARAEREEENSKSPKHRNTPGARTATNATPHGRRSFLVFMAASPRSRRRSSSSSSPLRGGHGGGFLPLRGGHVGGLFYINAKTTRNSLYIRRPPFEIAGTCLGSVPLRSTRAVKRFFWKKSKKKNNPKQPPQKTLPLAVSEGHGGQRRPSAEVTEVFCGHGRWSWRSRAEADGDLAVEENANASSRLRR